MKPQWLKKAPESAELVLEMKDERRGRRKVAVVIATNGNRKMLASHLSLLGRQTFRDFDVIIIYGSGSFAEKALPGRILHVREREANGAAGAFHLGERLALEQGYETIMLADDDCLPSSADLLEKLVSGTRDADIALPSVGYGKNHTAEASLILHQYGCVSRKAFAAGLTYLPLFIGGDDADLMRRMEKKGASLARVDAIATHPAIRPLFIAAPFRAYYYTRGTVASLFLSGMWLPAFLAIAAHLGLSISYAILGRTDSAKACMDALWDASGLRLFRSDKKYREDGTAVADEKPLKAEAAIPVMDGGFRPVFWAYGKRGPGPAGIAVEALPHLSRLPSCFGRAVLFDGAPGFAELPLLLAAKSARARWDGDEYVIVRPRGTAAIIAGLAALMAAAPAIIVAAAALTVRGVLTKSLLGAKSEGYGLQVAEKT